MTPKTRQERFFVSHLAETDRRNKEFPYEIQVLNCDGQAIACGCVDGQSDESDEVEIDGQHIPHPVIEAARRQQIGEGDYVDPLGRSVSPF